MRKVRNDNNGDNNNMNGQRRATHEEETEEMVTSEGEEGEGKQDEESAVELLDLHKSESNKAYYRRMRYEGEEYAEGSHVLMQSASLLYPYVAIIEQIYLPTRGEEEEEEKEGMKRNAQVEEVRMNVRWFFQQFDMDDIARTMKNHHKSFPHVPPLPIIFQTTFSAAAAAAEDRWLCCCSFGRWGRAGTKGSRVPAPTRARSTGPSASTLTWWVRSLATPTSSIATPALHPRHVTFAWFIFV